MVICDMPNKPKHDDPEQSRRFIELAQEREAQFIRPALDRAVKKIAMQERKEPKPKRSKPKG
jgi:hypothetical protein